MKLIVAFRNFANASNKSDLQWILLSKLCFFQPVMFRSFCFWGHLYLHFTFLDLCVNILYLAFMIVDFKSSKLVINSSML
jgi:hypothetical protein